MEDKLSNSTSKNNIYRVEKYDTTKNDVEPKDFVNKFIMRMHREVFRIDKAIRILIDPSIPSETRKEYVKFLENYGRE